MGLPPPSRPPPPPLKPPPIVAADRDRRGRLSSSRVMEDGSGPSPPMVAKLLGWHRSGAAGRHWRRCDLSTTTDGCRRWHRRPWSKRPGPIWALSGQVLRRLGVMVVEEMMWRGPGTAALRPAYWSTTAGASRAHPGLAEPDGA
jgi:hypothetical protein